jgi:hypothetical protein
MLSIFTQSKACLASSNPFLSKSHFGFFDGVAIFDAVQSDHVALIHSCLVY